MSLFHRRTPSSRRARPATPSCRGGASSLLRLAQPAAGQGGGSVRHWLARAANVLSPAAAEMVTVRPSEFAPSQWLVGH
ncbi:MULTISPECIES: hypothetical protein [unclassified Rhizobacter]|jgi:hypothetical protein|uniref:hypothetical protein n=1 Tax=unclassified Rhizobacter TaxID=2640088 RepID=UPI0006F62F1C|nr:MULTISPECIES: hypothetical protein [unclassified Rhizobacter]KQU78021.1 hypothetical protein ASC88_19500 [Rhizobacter sp. Root29]KQW15767.1 hypothetical protein ASC98_00720 [Rhizobacter sp. Root1238]KRB24879.1 hypothetical protein ASE08_01430 [Rhizobacter sp. Root16D2]